MASDDPMVAAGRVIAARPIRLEGAPRVLWVAQGAVDVFLARADRGEAPGARHPLCRIEAGVPLVIADLPEAARGWQALAVPLPESRLVELRLADAPAGALAAGLERWIGALLGSLDRRLAPARYEALEPGEPLALEAGAVCATALRTGWARLAEGELALLGEDGARFSRGELIALHPEAWAVARASTRLEPVDLAALFVARAFPDALARLQCALLTLFVAGIEASGSAAGRRLERRRAASVRAMDGALKRLASLLQPEEPALAAAGADDSVLAACRVAGRALGIPFPALPRGAARLAPQERLAAAVSAAQVRQRRVALRGRWWETDSGPLVGFREDGAAAVALIPRGGGGYDAVDPLVSGRTRVDAAFAQGLQPFAHAFFRAFPARRLGAWDLLRFGLAGLGAEMRTIVAMAALIGLLGLLSPIAIGILFDQAIPSADRPQLAQMSAMLLGAAVATLFFTLARAVALLRLEGRMDSGVQAAVWDRVLKLPVTFFRDYSAGDLATRINAINTIRQYLSGSTLNGILTAVFSAFNLVLLFYFDAGLAGLALALVAIAVAANAAVAFGVLANERPLAELQGKLSGQVLQYLTGIAKLRVAAAEPRAFAHWAERFSDARRHAVRAEGWRNAAEIFLPSFTVLASAALFYVVARQLSAAALGAAPAGTVLTTGEFVAFAAAFTGFLLNLVQLADTVLDLLRIVPQVERARPILESVPEVDPSQAQPGELRGQIDVSNLVFGYRPDGPRVLDDVSFSVKPGEFLAIVGPSGSGKSTLMRLLLRFERPASGSVYYDRQDLADLDPHAVRRQIGVVLQTSQMMPGDIFSNIVGTHPLTLDEAWEAARLCGLDEDIEAMPMGMHTVVSEGASTLSGGQRQRVLIARAIVRRPRILLFDEATSALDNRTQEMVSRSLERFKATRIVIAHRLSTIRHADRIIVLDQGRIAQSGTYEELIAAPGLFAELARRQMA